MTRLYQIPFRKTSRAKVNNLTDGHFIRQLFEVIIDTSVGVSNFRWSFFGKIEDGFLVVKNSIVLSHYPRKIKYLKDVLKKP